MSSKVLIFPFHIFVDQMPKDDNKMLGTSQIDLQRQLLRSLSNFQKPATSQVGVVEKVVTFL